MTPGKMQKFSISSKKNLMVGFQYNQWLQQEFNGSHWALTWNQ